MENIERKYYAVSFGDSKKYNVNEDDLRKYEDEIKRYISSEFAGEPDRFYVEPEKEECGADADYPALTHVEVEKIKSDLRRQMEVRDADRELNSNAAFSS